LSNNALRELRDELDDLQRHRSSIDGRIKGIEVILLAEQSDRTGRNHRDPKATARVSRNVPTSSRRGSLRNSVLEVLRSMPSGSDASEITKRLEVDGFRVGGVTKLQSRVSHELGRLRRRGVLRKRRKKYVVAGVASCGDGKESSNAEKQLPRVLRSGLPNYES
jgi:hypothetical protein